MPDHDIERRIVTGIIVSAEFARWVSMFWSDELIESPELRRVARWSLDYLAKYGRPPDSDIEAIYLDKQKTEAIPKAEAELIERVLQTISREYGRGENFSVGYLRDRTVRHLRGREIALHAEALQDSVERGDVEDADAAVRAFKPRGYATSRGVELGSHAGLRRMSQAFNRVRQPVVRYPGPLGDMLNDHLVRDGFVALLAPIKRGKTAMLVDLAIRAVRGRSNVAFFQAGDLTEDQLLARVGIYLARTSDQERYCAPRWRPVGDCVRNQFDTCRLKGHRNCDHGVFDEPIEQFKDRRAEFECVEALTEAAKTFPDYRPCDSDTCHQRWPTVWLERVDETAPLTGRRAMRLTHRFLETSRRRFKLATYPSGTLTCEEIAGCLDEWERQDDFVPDVIVVDYADLMTARVQEFRHRQDAIWRGLRGISQERHALVVTATQSDAGGLKQSRLNQSNFSEDLRKLAHVTAMFGLNQDPAGREKALGIVRVNPIVAREGAFSVSDEVVVLQDLAAGRAFLESYRR